ncbi:hypothetical protein C8Q74DRAFT_1234271 [Fomes fomentarius]|nr:hypothetical protein C8Q74DRAFT_1234271 [Fomes fomentarius]
MPFIQTTPSILEDANSRTSRSRVQVGGTHPPSRAGTSPAASRGTLILNPFISSLSKFKIRSVRNPSGWRRYCRRPQRTCTALRSIRTSKISLRRHSALLPNLCL